MKEVKPEAGEHIGAFARRLIEEAPAWGVFNGTRTEANPGDDLDIVLRRWDAASRVDKYQEAPVVRNSPESPEALKLNADLCAARRLANNVYGELFAFEKRSASSRGTQRSRSACRQVGRPVKVKKIEEVSIWNAALDAAAKLMDDNDLRSANGFELDCVKFLERLRK